MKIEHGIIKIIMPDGIKQVPVTIRTDAGFITYILPPGSVPHSITYPEGKSPIAVKQVSS